MFMFGVHTNTDDYQETQGRFPSSGFARMARGHQKIQSQHKNAKKQAEMKKAKGHDQKTAAKAALVFTCLVCRVSITVALFFAVS